MQTASGAVVQRAPLIYQETEGGKEAISGAYVLHPLPGGKRQGEAQYLVGITVAKYDPSIPLVIDPVLEYSTYLGGSGEDGSSGIAVDIDCNAYIVGTTSSTNFPAASPLQATYEGGLTDVFVVKLNSAGSALAYSTYLGGSGEDGSSGIAVDIDCNAYIVGTTSSTNFPAASPLQATYEGGLTDVFVVKLNPTGSALAYSTHLGGSNSDFGRGIAVDASAGDAYVTGFTLSADFPVANPLQATPGGGIRDAFVTKFNAEGSALLYSTHLGGGDWDIGEAIAVDALGNAYVTGYTGSPNFLTASPLQATRFCRLSTDAFMSEVECGMAPPSVYSTYLGGSSSDAGQSIAVD